jgi:hypothetical protein
MAAKIAPTVGGYSDAFSDPGASLASSSEWSLLASRYGVSQLKKGKREGKQGYGTPKIVTKALSGS